MPLKRHYGMNNYELNAADILIANYYVMNNYALDTVNVEIIVNWKLRITNER